MRLTYRPFELELNHPFTIAKFSRTSTPLMLLQIEHEGHIGYGEASMVPYMGESHQSATQFLSKVDVPRFKYPFDFGAIIQYLDEIAPGNPAIKAAIDIALHDLEGKLKQQPCWQLLGSDPAKMPVTSYTVGIDTPEVLVEKVKQGDGCKVIKVKLGRGSDKELINTIRSVTNLPLYVDANQGWTDRAHSLDMCHWLHERDVKLIEQPFAKTDPDDNAWLTERSPIPIIGDEAVQRFGDVEKAKGVYSGINVKLMKSAGMYEAHRMILKAKELGLKVLIGCMSETSCATLAAAALAPQCDWADLDGPLLVSNNPYQMPEFKDGKWVLNDRSGLGLDAGIAMG
ncbi:MAG: dipeptide epimerase [Bacteroidetes bacterium]|nr:dipeptide epimerase [Bacteroidota bacterium]